MLSDAEAFAATAAQWAVFLSHMLMIDILPASVPAPFVWKVTYLWERRGELGREVGWGRTGEGGGRGKGEGDARARVEARRGAAPVLRGEAGGQRAARVAALHQQPVGKVLLGNRGTALVGSGSQAHALSPYGAGAGGSGRGETGGRG